jgi:hypothetical protein
VREGERETESERQRETERLATSLLKPFPCTFSRADSVTRYAAINQCKQTRYDKHKNKSGGSRQSEVAAGLLRNKRQGNQGLIGILLKDRWRKVEQEKGEAAGARQPRRCLKCLAYQQDLRQLGSLLRRHMCAMAHQISHATHWRIAAGGVANGTRQSGRR